jgi:hypothetical protein
VRALRDYPSNSHTAEVLFVGALPMANVLVAGLLVGRRQRGSRRFLLGFEVFGALALALYIAMAMLWTGGLLQDYLDLCIDPIQKVIGHRGLIPLPIIIIAYSIIAVWASLPQLTFALIGGFLCRKLKAVEGPA